MPLNAKLPRYMMDIPNSSLPSNDLKPTFFTKIHRVSGFGRQNDV